MQEQTKQALEVLDAPVSKSNAALAPLPSEPPGDAQPANPAQWMYERLKDYIKHFESRLDDDHEIGARLVSFGEDLTFHIEDMGYYGPDIITFYGKDDKGQTVQLIQHTSQLSVLLVAVRKQSDRPRRIGFVLDGKDGDASNGRDESPGKMRTAKSPEVAGVGTGADATPSEPKSPDAPKSAGEPAGAKRR